MKYKFAIIIITYIIILFIGIWIGRTRFGSDPKIIYKELDPIHDTLRMPVPIKEQVPGNPKYLYKNDTVYNTKDSIIYRTISQSIDTANILKDWITQRSYKESLLNNDTVGKLTVEAIIQYNKLQELSYEFHPIQKITELNKNRRSEIIGGIGFSTNNLMNIQLGIFPQKYFGVSYQFSRDLTTNKNYHGLNMMIRY